MGIDIESLGAEELSVLVFGTAEAHQVALFFLGVEHGHEKLSSHGRGTCKMENVHCKIKNVMTIKMRPRICYL